MIAQGWNIKKYLGHRLVLRDVSFVLKPGERTIVTGRNGAGKSTLLSCLAGAQRIDGGSLAFFGGAPSSRRSRATGDTRVGYVSQTCPFLHPLLSPRENLMLIAELARKSSNNTLKSDELNRVNGLLMALGMNWFADQRTFTLSEGMRRRLMIARALIASPQLLLLDEPTTGLDDEGVELLEESLRQFTLNGGALILVSHDRDFGRQLLNSGYVLSHGRLEPL